MLDHVSLAVADFARSRAFYEKALAPLGISVLMGVDGTETGGRSHLGFGDTRPFFWIGSGDGAARTNTHVAFSAPTRAIVDAFHAAALAAGGIDHGAPGLRPHYHAQYYGAFVLDPDGYNIEAVCHAAEG